jgi:Zn-dependent protease with chaperone function
MNGTPRFLSRKFPVLLLSFLLAACSTPLPVSIPSAVSNEHRSALTTLIATQDRLYRIAAPLLVRNAVLCRSYARPLLGFTAKNQYSFPSKFADAAKELLKAGEQLQVMSVLEGSGAARAGIQRGDILQSVQEQPLPQGPNAETEAAHLLAGLVRNATTLQILLMRNGSPIKLDVPLTLACAFSVELGNADLINAYNDGRRILITRGMLHVLQTDNELASILAREMAHNILQHAQALQMTGTVAGVMDKLLPLQPDLTGLAGSAGIKSMPAKMDQDADKLALYLLARAGYAFTVAGPAWQRLAQVYPASMPNSYTALHPMTAERLSLLQMTIDEIRQKQAAKKPLVP